MYQYGISARGGITKCWLFTVADPGEGPTPLPLFLDQTEARRAEIFFVLDPPPLSRGQGDRALPYLKVRICSYGAQPLVKSFCKTLLKSLFWALTCVPGFEYAP